MSMLVKGTITVPNSGGNNQNDVTKKVILKNCVPFTHCISKINNTQLDNTKDIDVVMPLCSLIEYWNSYSKTCGSLCQCYRDEPNLNADGNAVNFSNANNSTSFKKT